MKSNIYKQMAYTFEPPVSDEAFRQALYRAYRGRCQYSNEDNGRGCWGDLQIDHIIPHSMSLERVYEVVYNRLKRWKGIYRNMDIPEGVARDVCDKILPPSLYSVLNLTLACACHNCEWKIDGLLPIDELIRVLKIAKKKAYKVLKIYAGVLKRKKTKIELIPYARCRKQEDSLQETESYNLFLRNEKSEITRERVGRLIIKNGVNFVKMDKKLIDKWLVGNKVKQLYFLDGLTEIEIKSVQGDNLGKWQKADVHEIF